MGTLATNILGAAQSLVQPWLLVVCLGLLLAAVGYNLWGGRQRRHLSSRLDAANSQLSHLRSVDTLTGLATRAEFEQQLETETLAADRSGASLSLIYVGLDNFRTINEAFGLPVGDSLLSQVGKRLAAFRPAEPRPARAAGDEFVLMVRGGPDLAVAAVAELHLSMSAPFTVDSLKLPVSASMGIAVYPNDGARPRLIPHAALAMRSVKLGGGGSHARFDTAMIVNLREQAELLQDLRSALARNQLQLYYQPKIDARTLQITAAEALLRWQHPHRGMISPTVFIPPGRAPRVDLRHRSVGGRRGLQAGRAVARGRTAHAHRSQHLGSSTQARRSGRPDRGFAAAPPDPARAPDLRDH